LEDDFIKTKEETTKAMESLAISHEAALAKALADQCAKEAEWWKKMQEDMEYRLQAAQQSLEQEQEARRYELEMTKADAEQRLSTEVAARDERMVEEQQTYYIELAATQAKADKNMTEERGAKIIISHVMPNPL
jgi:predicted chitinase